MSSLAGWLRRGQFVEGQKADMAGQLVQTVVEWHALGRGTAQSTAVTAPTATPYLALQVLTVPCCMRRSRHRCPLPTANDRIRGPFFQAF